MPPQGPPQGMSPAPVWPALRTLSPAEAVRPSCLPCPSSEPRGGTAASLPGGSCDLPGEKALGTWLRQHQHPCPSETPAPQLPRQAGAPVLGRTSVRLSQHSVRSWGPGPHTPAAPPVLKLLPAWPGSRGSPSASVRTGMPVADGQAASRPVGRLGAGMEPSPGMSPTTGAPRGAAPSLPPGEGWVRGGGRRPADIDRVRPGLQPPPAKSPGEWQSPVLAAGTGGERARNMARCVCAVWVQGHLLVCSHTRVCTHAHTHAHVCQHRHIPACPLLPGNVP